MKRLRLWLAHRAEVWAFDQQMRYGQPVELNAARVVLEEAPTRPVVRVNPEPATWAGGGEVYVRSWLDGQ